MRRKQRQIIAMFTILTMLLPLLAGCGSNMSDLPEMTTQGAEEAVTTEAPAVTTEAPTGEEGTTTEEVPATETPDIGEVPATETPDTGEITVTETPVAEFIIPEFAPVIGVREVVAPQYDVAWPFSEGYAVVGVEQGEEMKYNYIDTEGKLLLDEWVDIALSFSEGLACVGFDAGITVEKYNLPLYRFGYVDTSGEMAIPAEILCYGGHYPRAFYDGYAEIFYVDPDGEEVKVDYQGVVVKSNVIDREGNRLFDEELSYLSTMYLHGYYRSRARVLPIEAEMDELDYCMHNEWVRNRVNREIGDSLVYSHLEGLTYVVDAGGKIERTFQGSLTRLGEKYYVFDPQNGENKSLYDRDFNLISDGEYRSFREGVEGQIIVSVSAEGENGGWKRYEQVLDEELEPVSDRYRMIERAGDGYKGYKLNQLSGIELFGTDGQVTRQISENLDAFQYFRDGYYNEAGFCWAEEGFFIGTYRDRTNYEDCTRYYYSSTGELFHSGKDAVCRQVSADLFCIGIKGGKGQLINREFEVLLELPKADVINYAGDAENIYLCSYEGEVVYWYHLSKEDGAWKIAEEGTGEKETFNRTIDGWRFTIDANGISQIISETEYDGVAALEWRDGSVLDEGKAVSLVADGLYLVAENQKHEVSYGYDAWDYCLKFDGKAVSEVYDELDVISEDHIAFSRDGKWGYLKIERGEVGDQVFGDEPKQKIELESPMIVDLDGDGQLDKILITAVSEDCWYSAEEVSVQINDRCYTGDELAQLLGGGWMWLDDGCFWLTDLDTSDRWVELAIVKSDGSSLGTDTRFFRWDGGEIRTIGETRGYMSQEGAFRINIAGDGTVSVSTILYVIQMVPVTKNWELKNSSGADVQLEEVIPEYYEFKLREQDAKMTLIQELTFFAGKDGNETDLITLPAGTKIDIARFYPEDGWIRIVYDQDTKSVWLRKTEENLILPVNVDEWEMTDYIDRLYLAG